MVLFKYTPLFLINFVVIVFFYWISELAQLLDLEFEIMMIICLTRQTS